MLSSGGPLQRRVHLIDEMAHVLVLPTLPALVHGLGEGELSIRIGEPERAAGAEVAEGARVRPEGALPHGELESEPEARRPLEDEILPALLPTCRQAATSTVA